MIFLIFILLLLLFPLEIPANKNWIQKHSSESIDIHEGLAHHHIDDISQDSRGFIWVSTVGGGLVRYDGYEFIEFCEHSPIHPLKNNFVHDSNEDPFGRLWVGSKGGIDVIDTYSLAPIDIITNGRFIEKLMTEETYKIFGSNGNDMWVSNHAGFFRVGLDNSGNIETLDTILLHKTGGQHVTSFLTESDYGVPLVGYNNVVLKLTPSSTPGSHCNPDTLLTFPPGYLVRAMHRYQDKLWIGTCWGLFCYDAARGEMRTYRTDNRPNSLSQDYITDMTIHHTENNGSHLIVSTLMGFNIYRPQTDDFERVTSNTPSPTYRPLLKCNFINCLMSDGQTLWVGTEAGGISRIYPNNLTVENIMFHSEITTGDSSNPINAIHEDAHGQIWIGRVEGGLTRIDAEHRLVETYTTDSPYTTGLSHNSVSCLTNDHMGRLWIGTWGKGVCRMETSIRKPDNSATYQPFIRHLTTNRKEASPNREMVRTMCYDSINNYIWIYGHFIHAYDLEKDTFLLPLANTGISSMKIGNVGMAIDSKGFMWMATENGLLAIDLTTVKDSVPSFRLWKEVAGLDMTKVTTKHITVTQNGSIWIATDGYGIIHIDSYSKQPTVISTQNGLIDNNVRGILEADDHTIWISTLKGISRYNPHTGQSDNFISSDGIPASPFYTNAACKGRDGTLYFGSMIGVTVINPAKTRIPTDRYTGKMAFTHIYTTERTLSTRTGRVTIHEREKTLEVRFSSLTYNRMPTETYAYRLQGFDDENTWICTNERSATYTNLHPGTYTLQVKYAAAAEDWNPHMAELQIEVIPYFYKTWWFKLCIFILLSLVAYAFYAWRVNTLKQQKKLLHRKVEEHTLTLRLQKEELAERAQELELKNHLLTEQNEEITRQKNEIIHMAQQQFAYSMSPDELHIPAHSPDIELLNRTLEIIKQNYPNPEFEINDIINALGVSRTMLYTKIQKLTGDSIGNLLRNYRLTMAHRLIAETQPSQSLTIAEIAYRVGFNDPKYFSRCFAKQFGCPPSKVLDEKNE